MARCGWTDRGLGSIRSAKVEAAFARAKASAPGASRNPKSAQALLGAEGHVRREEAQAVVRGEASAGLSEREVEQYAQIVPVLSPGRVAGRIEPTMFSGRRAMPAAMQSVAARRDSRRRGAAITAAASREVERTNDIRDGATRREVRGTPDCLRPRSPSLAPLEKHAASKNTMLASWHAS